ncbi:hypothetical protein RB601_003887 [Gaeumannomyces tritici]
MEEARDYQLAYRADPLQLLVRASVDDGKGVPRVDRRPGELMYGTGDFDSSWGAATRLILKAIGDTPAAKQVVIHGRDVGTLAPKFLAAETAIQGFSERTWLDLHACVEATARKSAARAEQFIGLAQAQVQNFPAGTRQQLERPSVVMQEWAVLQRELVSAERRVRDAQEWLEKSKDNLDTSRRQPMPDPGMIIIWQENIVMAQRQLCKAKNLQMNAENGPKAMAIREPASTVHRELLALAFPSEPGLAAADAGEPDETCNYYAVTRWIRSSRAARPPRVECPICQEVEFTACLGSLFPIGYPAIPNTGGEVGILMNGCKHILGTECFREMERIASKEQRNLVCPICRAKVIPDKCILLEHAIGAEFSKIAGEQREMMNSA